MESKKDSQKKFSLIKQLAKVSGMNPDIIDSGINKTLILGRSAIGALLIAATTLIAAGIANFAKIPFPENDMIPIIIFVIVWIAFFWFDLSFITSIDQMRNKSSKKLLVAFGIRLLVLLPFSILSSNGLLLRIYDQEIKNQITLNRLENDRIDRKQIARQIDSLNQRKSEINGLITAATNEFTSAIQKKEIIINDNKSRLQKKNDLLVAEVEGKLQRAAGFGAAAKAKKAQIEEEKLEIKNLERELENEKKNGPSRKLLTQKEELLNAEIAIIDNMIAELNKIKEEKLGINKQIATLGFQDQYNALQKIKKDGQSKFIMNILLIALIFFELIPLLVKLFQAMQGTSEYERILHINLENEEMEAKLIEHKKFNHIFEDEKKFSQERKKQEYEHDQKMLALELEIQQKKNEELSSIIKYLNEYQKNLGELEKFKQDKKMRGVLKKLKIA